MTNAKQWVLAGAAQLQFVLLVSFGSISLANTQGPLNHANQQHVQSLTDGAPYLHRTQENLVMTLPPQVRSTP